MAKLKAITRDNKGNVEFKMKILVTGGAGFIGSALCRYLLAETADTIINVDALRYSANTLSVEQFLKNPRYKFEKADICDSTHIEKIFSTHQPDVVMNLAAETHVDRSIDGPEAFIKTNIVGTFTMLQVARKYWSSLPDEKRHNFRFHHISTDEVFGTLGETGKFCEDTAYKPNSPYSASKASSDHLVRAWYETFGLPVLISNCSNNYGPYQFPEKLIPVLVLNALSEKALPIYGEGKNVRDWLYVDDHVRALYAILTKGAVGKTYAIGGNAEMKNIDIARCVCSILDEVCPRKNAKPYSDLITFVPDRPGHDLRYAIDSSKIHAELKWHPSETFQSGIKKTVLWYLENVEWCEKIGKNIHQKRLGIDI